MLRRADPLASDAGLAMIPTRVDGARRRANGADPRRVRSSIAHTAMSAVVVHPPGVRRMWAVRIPLSLVASRWILAGSLALLLYPAAPTLAGDRAGAFPDVSGRIVQEAGRAASIGVVTQLPGRHTGDEVLVRFKDGVTPSERAAGHAQARGTVVKRFWSATSSSCACLRVRPCARRSKPTIATRTSNTPNRTTSSAPS